MISVALCTYNGEHFIKEQLESIVNQTMPVNEIVVCDDGSTDSTIQIIKSIATQHKNIEFKIIINDNNIGVKRNFEKALIFCKGDIKFLSDQDDIWMPNKVQTVVDYFKIKKDKDVVITNATLIDWNDICFTSKTLFECVGLDSTFLEQTNNDSLIDLFICGNRATGATMAIKKKVRVYFDYPNEILHDYILAIEALARNSFGIIEIPLIKYRIHNEQKCGLGDAINESWSNNIYNLVYEDFHGYTLPEIFHKKITMRDKRYHWIAGLRGIFHILNNWMLYKNIYPTNWKSFISTDIRHTIINFKKRKSIKEIHEQ